MFSPALPEPILFHPFKHHLGFILKYINENRSIKPDQLRTDLLSLGTSQLDLYFGSLSSEEIAMEIIIYLQTHKLINPLSFRQFLDTSGSDYRCITLSDKTDWVLRWGVVENRHVHLHPARYTGHTTRVKAAALKTAIATVIMATQLKLPIFELSTVNRVREDWLELSPVKWLNEQEGIGKFLKLLHQHTKT